jgi:hypothetical protein
MSHIRFDLQSALLTVNLYTALSRIRKRDDGLVLFSGMERTDTINVVYKNCYNN